MPPSHIDWNRLLPVVPGELTEAVAPKSNGCPSNTASYDAESVAPDQVIMWLSWNGLWTTSNTTPRPSRLGGIAKHSKCQEFTTTPPTARSKGSSAESAAAEAHHEYRTGIGYPKDPKALRRPSRRQTESGE